MSELRKALDYSRLAEIDINPNERHMQALEFIENVTRNAGQVQAQVLSSILTQNAETEYLKRYNLNGRTDKESFKECLPVITYEDLLPDIRRIANGDTSPILCALPFTEFLVSSGTSSGEGKLIPTIRKELERRTFFFTFPMAILTRFVQGLDKGKALHFVFARAESKAPGGLAVRSFITSYLKTQRFGERSNYDPYNVHTSPKEVVLCTDVYQSMYAQLLCGLLQNDQVMRVGADFASCVVRAMHFLEQHWKALCHDIRTATLNPELTDSSLREAVMKILRRPRPELADLIHAECSKGSWQGIIPRLWPNTKCIAAIVTGSMSQYVASLDYYSGGLPLVSSLYASSECNMGLNLKPLCKPSETSYTFMPNMAYFEFLPVHRNPSCALEADDRRPVDLVDVKMGEEYEPVVTTNEGLYRYRVGDLLRVTGFHNDSPQFEFVCRKNVVLSIDFDKTEELELQNAVKKSVKDVEHLGGRLVQYTGYADTSTVPGHYVLFWELQCNTWLPPSVLEECCLTIEESLNSVYRWCRVSDKSIGPLEIRVVQTGTFHELMDYAISRGASMSQYKTPKSIKLTPMVELLNSRVTHTYFSPRCPQWTPSMTKLVFQS